MATKPMSSGFEDKDAVAGAFIAAGIGVLVMGVLQFVAELNESFNDALAFNQRLGPYSGKYLISYLAWLVSWAILYPATRRGPITIRQAVIIMAVMVVVGAILLFPPFIGLFVSE